jgi:hypothetical protein
LLSLRSFRIDRVLAPGERRLWLITDRMGASLPALTEEKLMIRRFAVLLSCIAMTSTALVEGQVIEERTQPQPPAGAPAPDSLQRRRGPRVRVPATPPAGTTTAPVEPRRPMLSAFVVPPGLSQPIEYLFSDLGFESGKTVPLTPHTTFDIAYKCYAKGLYSDAMIFASHGLQICNDARLHLLKGVCEMHRGLGSAAELTAVDYRNAIAAQQMFGLDVAHERINDSMAVRFSDIVEYQATGH